MDAREVVVPGAGRVAGRAVRVADEGAFMVDEGAFMGQRTAFVAHEGACLDHEGGRVDHEGGFIEHEGGRVAHEGAFIDHEGGHVGHEGACLDHEGSLVVHERAFIDHEGDRVAHEDGLVVEIDASLSISFRQVAPSPTWVFERQEGRAERRGRTADQKGEMSMNTNRPTQQARDAQVIKGIAKNLQNAPGLALAGMAFTPTTLTQLVQSRIDAADAIAAANAAFHTKVAAFQVLNAQVTKVLRGLRQLVINTFGEDSTVLTDFGFTAPKKSTLTPEQLVERAQKAAATRAARGTKGPKAKLKVKGTVDTTAPATPAEPTPPAVQTPPKT